MRRPEDQVLRHRDAESVAGPLHPGARFCPSVSSLAAVARSGPHGRGGYSLAELVLALGVLAIGMTMAAALFPTAIKLNEQSNRDSVGTLIAANGLAIAKAMLLGSQVTDPNLAIIADGNHTSAIPLNLQYYTYDPNDPNTWPPTRGFLVLGRPLNGTYQLVIVSYDMYSPGNTVTAKLVQIARLDPPAVGGAPLVTLGDSAPVGSPLIVAKNGSYAMITGRDPNDLGNLNKGLLDHMIDAQTNDDAWVIEESGVAKSPAMTVLVGETTLESGP